MPEMIAEVQFCVSFSDLLDSSGSQYLDSGSDVEVAELDKRSYNQWRKGKRSYKEWRKGKRSDSSPEDLIISDNSGTPEVYELVRRGGRLGFKQWRKSG